VVQTTIFAGCGMLKDGTCSEGEEIVWKLRHPL